jgi:hypothetical protein
VATEVFYSDLKPGDVVKSVAGSVVIIEDRPKSAVPEPNALLVSVRHAGGSSLVYRSEGTNQWSVMRSKGDARVETDPPRWITWAEIVKALNVSEVNTVFKEVK